MNRRFGSNGISTNVTRTVCPSSIKNAVSHNIIDNNTSSFCPQGYYDEDISLKTVYNYVIQNFKQQRAKVAELNQIIESKNKYLESNKLKVIEIRSIQNEIKKLREQKSNFLSNEKQEEYQERASPFLEEWDAIKKEEGPIKFGQKRKHNQEKMVIVRNFIRLSSEYAQLDLIPNKSDNPEICPNCYNKYIKEDNKLICEECGIYQNCLLNAAEYNDLARINSSNSGDYQNRETFEKSLTNYQGKQQATFPDDLKERFLEYCKNNLIKLHTLNNESTRPIFKKLGYTNYGDINLFLSLVTGKKLHDLTQWEEFLLQDYDLFDQKYNEIKGDDRDSSLGGDYVLYILMERRNIPCDKRDLKLADTPSIRLENDNLARKTFNALNWNFKDTI